MTITFKKHVQFLLIFTIALLNITSTLIAEDKTEKKPELNIVGGDYVDIKEYPWQVAIFMVDEEGNLIQQVCGGSIIDPYWILTAAHCILGKAYETQKIVAEITNLNDSQFGQILEISDYFINENFDELNMSNDVALLRLSMPIDTSKLGASVIPFMSHNLELDGLIDPGVMATITGWGQTAEGGSTSDTLKAGVLPIISIETANQWFEETESGVPLVTEGMLPSGFEEGGVSGCHGDSGGPLIVKDNNGNWILAGITSWGKVCAGKKQPAIYTRVPYYYDWIINYSRLGLNENPIKSDYVDILKIEIDSNVYICDDKLNFGNILIRNFGTNNLENFQLNVNIRDLQNNNVIISDSSFIQLNPTLPPNGSKRIQMPNVLPPDYGSYIAEIVVNKPNNQDIDLENNTVATQFLYSEPSIINVKFDMKDIEELVWNIYDMSDFSLVKTGYLNSDNSNQETTESFCLPNGTYQFSVQGIGEGISKLTINHKGDEYLLYKSETQNNTIFNSAYFRLPFEPINDLKLRYNTDISNDTLFVCDFYQLDDIPYFSIINNGSILAENILCRFTINGNVTDTLFDENISSYTSIYYPILLDDLKEGENNIKAEILSYNENVTETNPEDNTFEIKFNILTQPKFGTLEIRPDDEYWYYSWVILNSDGDTIVYDYPNNQGIIINDLCLPEGCYIFLPNDQFDQGMQSETAAILKDNNGKIIFSIKGSDFKSSNPVPFCNTLTDVENQESDQLFIYPNPANDILYMYSTNELYNPNIRIIDALGKIYYEGKPICKNCDDIKIDLTKFHIGLYFVEIKSKNKSYINKFTIIR